MSGTISTIVHKIQRVVDHPPAPHPVPAIRARTEIMDTEYVQAPPPLPTYDRGGITVVYERGATIDRTA